MSAKLMLAIILGGVAIVFMVQNATPVDLAFLFWTLSMSRTLLLFLVLSLGFILGWLLHGNFRKT